MSVATRSVIAKCWPGAGRRARSPKRGGFVAARTHIHEGRRPAAPRIPFCACRLRPAGGLRLMNVLMLTAYPPVLHMHGGGVRMYHNIRLLAEKHSVRVISFVENDEERELLRTLNGVCELVTAVRRVP